MPLLLGRTVGPDDFICDASHTSPLASDSQFELVSHDPACEDNSVFNKELGSEASSLRSLSEFCSPSKGFVTDELRLGGGGGGNQGRQFDWLPFWLGASSWAPSSSPHCGEIARRKVPKAVANLSELVNSSG